MICNNILEAMGHTPLVRLNRLPEPGSAEILVKVEALNVGGSIKSRTALNMIEGAEKAGLLSPGSILVEPTSGNQGIGLARLVHDDGDIGKCIEACLQTALRMREEDPRVFIPQQFENPDNKLTHIKYTAQEILEQAGRPIHGFCSGIGTGGTISGIGEVLKERNPDIEIWAVEPENAAILSGGAIGTHIQMGIGDGIIPEILNREICSEVCIVTDGEALHTARRLAREEGLMCGISSGTNVAAALRLAKKLGPGRTVVTVLPDTAERYFSTPLFDGE